jgi:diacylglycerol kinase (ATP)
MTGKKKIVFIINPISGVGKKNTVPPLIEKHLDHSLFDYEVQYTQHRGHGRELAAALKNSADAIIAVGGDGSVNEIGSALIGSNCSLGIIPCGSGNGLARHAKVPLRFVDAIKRINTFNVQKIDTGKVNEHYFLGTCGFGFDAHVAQKFDEYHKRGFFSYIKLVLREYRNYTARHFVIEVNGKTLKRTAFMFSVANSSQFGNGFTISPLSDLQDGKFELIFLKAFPWYRVPGLARRFFNRSIHRSPLFESVIFENTATVYLENAGQTALHLDGEPVGISPTFHIQLLSKSLQII